LVFSEPKKIERQKSWFFPGRLPLFFEEAGKNGRVQNPAEKVENPANLKRKQKKPLQI